MKYPKTLIALLTVLLLGSQMANAAQYSVVVPSGQTLYFNQISGSVNNVVVTHPSNSDNAPYGGYTAPAGDLVIPSTILGNL